MFYNYYYYDASPEYEYEQDQQGEEGRDIVHRLEHDNQLSPECR